MISPILLALALVAPPDAGRCEPSNAPACAPFADRALRDRVRGLLGSIDRPVAPEEWRALPPEAVAILRSIAADPRELPTQRAHALDGLAALGVDPALHQRLAEDGSAPFLVRDGALRGLAALLPPNVLLRTLSPLLSRDPDLRVRASAAGVLAGAKPDGGCAAVRAQAAHEREQDRAAFRRALAACGDR